MKFSCEIFHLWVTLVFCNNYRHFSFSILGTKELIILLSCKQGNTTDTLHWQWWNCSCWPLVAFTIPPRTNVFTPLFSLVSNDAKNSSKTSAAFSSSWRTTQRHGWCLHLLCTYFLLGKHYRTSITPSQPTYLFLDHFLFFLCQRFDWGGRFSFSICHYQTATQRNKYIK